jgi:peptidyl-prolyl cis-trans isomerase D
MSKEKNIQPQVEATNKKESTSILEKIRRRTGLLVGIVGLALVIFILESLLGSGASIFGGNEQSSIGSIHGKNIDRNEFLTKVENQLNIIRQQKQTNDIDDATRGQVLDYVWQQYVSDLVIKPQYDKVGITVGEDEVYERVVAHPVPSVAQRLTDQKTGKVYEQLAGPDGGLDPAKFRAFVQNATGDQEMFIKQMEDDIKNMRYAEKYATLIRKGLYATTVEAKESFKAQQNKINFSYVIKRFDSVSDSTVKVTDDDIANYVKAHASAYKKEEETRSIAYVTFSAVPSSTDSAAVLNDVVAQKQDFTAATDNAGFLNRVGSDIAYYDGYFSKNRMQQTNKDTLVKIPTGTVYGPYVDGNAYVLAKMIGVKNLPDSAKVRHILIATSNPSSGQQIRPDSLAKNLIDSIKLAIAGGADFGALALKYSDDGGSKNNGGVIDYFPQGKMLGAFNDFSFEKPKGTKDVV